MRIDKSVYAVVEEDCVTRAAQNGRGAAAEPNQIIAGSGIDVGGTRATAQIDGVVAAADDCRGCRPTKDRVAATAEDHIRSACGADYDLHIAERAVDAGGTGPGDDRIADPAEHGRGATAQGNELATGDRIDQCGARRSAQIYRIAGRSNDRCRVRTAANGIEMATEDVVRAARRADLDPDRAGAGIDKPGAAAAVDGIPNSANDALIAAPQRNSRPARHRVIAGKQLQRSDAE